MKILVILLFAFVSCLIGQYMDSQHIAGAVWFSGASALLAMGAIFRSLFFRN